jgi:hypothetical protein
MNITNQARFPIGTQFLTRGKNPKLCQVVDILYTFNHAGQQVALRYVASHQFMGQIVTDANVVDATIAIGIQTLNQVLNQTKG